MSHNPGNPIRRDGTSQTQRLLEALKPDYVKVEERSLKDLLSFTHALAEEIAYYDTANQRQGNWQDFFPTPDALPELPNDLFERQDHAPHFALLIAFSTLLDNAKQDINRLTARHLDYYYKQVLQLKEKPARPHHVHVLFELAKQVHQHLVPAGTLLNAGKDKQGIPLLYQTDRDIVVNKARVESVKTVLVDANNDNRIYAAAVANSADGQGAPLQGDEPSWSPFGESQLGKDPEARTMQDAEIGFALASPILLLKEGNRTITLTLELKSFMLTAASLSALGGELSEPVLSALGTLQDQQLDTVEVLEAAVRQRLAGLQDDGLDIESMVDAVIREIQHPLRHLQDANLQQVFTVYASGEQGWIELAIEKIEILPPDQNRLQIEMSAPPEYPGIVPYHQDTLPDAIDTQWPVLKIILSPLKRSYLYGQLRALQIQAATIKVDVDGVRDLILQNDQGSLDPSQAFLPFGSTPAVGSTFYIGSNEVFQKQLSRLELVLHWAELPPEDFSTHYDGYDGEKYQNDALTAGFSLLNQRQWLSSSDTVALFVSEGTELEREAFAKSVAVSPLARNAWMVPVTRYEPTVQRGFARLVLSGQDFGHRQFPTLYAEAAIIKATGDTTVSLPNPPYTPKLKSLALNYVSSQHIELRSDFFPEQFFHIEPFGSRQMSYGETIYLLPQYDRGTLYMGIADLAPPQNLNLLFQVAEGSGDPDVAITSEDIHWSYLAGNEWVALGKPDILTDTTFGLQDSGILSVSMGRDATCSHTLLPQGMHWLRATTNTDPAGASRLIDIKTQAITAGFLDQGNDPDHLRLPLPAAQISKLKDRNPAIRGVSQPYASFGGRAEEQPDAFYTRVSERLRHKKRAVTLWDYERMVLEEFPSIYKTKCLNHAHGHSESAAGCVMLVVIPNLRNQNAVNPLEPKVSLPMRTRVQEYMSRFVPLFVTLEVSNPIYERLRLDFKVGFKHGFDDGYYAGLLNEDIKRFLSPWAYEEGKDIVFGGKIYKSAILAFIEERDYVDYIVDFRLYHFKKRPGIGAMVVEVDFAIQPEEVDVAEASTGRSILVSAPDHRITVLKAGEYACPVAKEPTGIGGMIIEVDFVVS